ncbi:MAG TPA: pilus assembly protein PilP [Burkholderiales bacterium]|nr:pilus assembly protein PilP [Burkholderiales bacterium]
MRLALLLLVWSVSSFAQVPKVLVATIQPGLGPAQALQLDGTTLVYTTRVGPNVEAQKITPTPAQWSAFRRALDAQKVWRWHGNYDKSNAPDTTTWSLKLEYADRSVMAAGAAAFPDRSTDRSLPKYAFNRYQLALQELIGRSFGRGVKPIEVFDLSELKLVATHPSENETEQWADFRDPRGKVHRALLHEPVGGRGKLAQVNRSSVSLTVVVKGPKGEWQEQERIMQVSPSKK